MGINTPPSSLAAAPPAKPSLTAAPTYPNTADSKSLASATMPPKVEYPATAASFNAPGSAAKNPLIAATKTPLMAPQKGRYGEVLNPVSGYKNPIYNTPASATSFQRTPLVQNPYRASVPAIPQSNGSLAAPAVRNPIQSMPNPVQNSVSTDSRYQAAIASSASRASASTYSNDPNSRYYAVPAAKTTAVAPGSPILPKVVSGYPGTSTGLPVVTTAKAPASRYPVVPSPANVTAPANSRLPAANHPVASPAIATPPSASYQPGANQYVPGANQYVPGANQYVPGVNSYQIPAVRSTAPIQSGSQPVGNTILNSSAGKTPTLVPLAPTAKNNTTLPFRPGSTGNVEGYPWASGASSTSGTYPSTQTSTPLKTSINTSNVMPVGFNQDSLLLRR